MWSFWTGVTAPQATIISGLCTLAAALFGVLVGWWLFNGRVRDLKSAIEESDKLLKKHGTDVAEQLAGVRSQFEAFGGDFAAQMEVLGQLRSSVSDIQDATATEPEGADADRKDLVRGLWYEVRDRLEALAADPVIDGRTRAAFARIDRRSYATLVAALDARGFLGGQRQLYLDAVALWSRYRNGRRRPTNVDMDRMQAIKDEVVPAAAG